MKKDFEKDIDKYLFATEVVQAYIGRCKIALGQTILSGIATVISIIVMLVYCKTPISAKFFSASMVAICSLIIFLFSLLSYYKLKKWLAKFELPKQDENEKTK